VDRALTLIAPIRPLQLCADGGYQLRLGVLGVPLIMVPDNMRTPFVYSGWGHLHSIPFVPLIKWSRPRKMQS
jgi:hypothetical protein